MAKRDKYRNKKLSDFFDYTEGKMSDRERNAFERRMQKDPFESDAAEGFSRVSREEAEQDLHTSAGSIRRRTEGVGNKTERNRRIAGAGSRTKRNRRIAWYSAAAAIASLMIVTTVFFRLNDNGLERFETAPEMQEAAREQPAPLQEGDVEQDGPVAEKAMEQEEPVGKDAMEQEEPVQETIVEDEEMVQEDGTKEEFGMKDPDDQKTGAKAATAKEMSEKGIVSEEEIKADATFPVTAGPDAKKGYDLKEMQMHQEQQAMDREVQAMAKPPPAVSDDRQRIEEDHAFAWEKMEEEAAAGRYNETQQRIAAPKAATEQPMEIDLAPDEISLDEVVAGVADFKSYIDTTLVYPELTETSGREVVVLKFTVSPEGRPQNFRVIRAPDDEAFEKEAIRVVSEGPAWQPATKNGQYTEEEVRLRIVFRKD